MRRAQPEQALQRQITKFLLAALAGNSWFSALPLGGGGELRGRILKGTGTARGLPDILITNDGRAIFLELKAPKGIVSDAQLGCHAAIKRSRCPVYVCRSIEDVERALRESGVPLRATSGAVT